MTGHDGRSNALMRNLAAVPIMRATAAIAATDQQSLSEGLRPMPHRPPCMHDSNSNNNSDNNDNKHDSDNNNNNFGNYNSSDINDSDNNSENSDTNDDNSNDDLDINSDTNAIT